MPVVRRGVETVTEVSLSLSYFVLRNSLARSSIESNCVLIIIPYRATSNHSYIHTSNEALALHVQPRHLLGDHLREIGQPQHVPAAAAAHADTLLLPRPLFPFP